MKEIQDNKLTVDAHEKALEAGYQKALAAHKKNGKIENLNNLTAAKKALSDYCRQREVELDPSKLTFLNLARVLDYLQAEGWRLEKSKLHKDKGKLKKESDGTYTKKTIDEYARLCLEKKDGLPGDDITDIVKRKALAALANEEEDLKTKILIREAMEGKLIALLEVKQKQTAKLAMFLVAVDNIIYGGSLEEAIEIVAGDMRKIKAFQTFIKKQFSGALAEYAKSPHFSVPKKSILKAMEFKDNDE